MVVIDIYIMKDGFLWCSWLFTHPYFV